MTRPASRTRRKRLASLIRIYHDKCVYCGVQLTDGVPSGKRQPATMRTVDHWIPQSMGGSSRLENLLLCCRACNHKKADKLLERPTQLHEENVSSAP